MTDLRVRQLEPGYYRQVGNEFHRLDDRHDLYASLSDENEGIEEMLSDWRAAKRRFVRAFAIAVAIFCVVYFGLQLLRGVL